MFRRFIQTNNQMVKDYRGVFILRIATHMQSEWWLLQPLNYKMQQIEWRRYQVLELSSKGHNQSEISRILQVDKSNISRDMSYLREQSRINIRKYVDERLPEEYEKCMVGLTAILKEAWNTAEQASDRREKIQALTLAKDCYSMKLELLTNATVIDDAIKFVSNNLLKDQKNEKAKHRKAKHSDSSTDSNINKNDIQRFEEENNESGESNTTNQTF